ncbi:photosynthetic protein synthase I [Thalassotalea insulae]|uniref:Photosynthetic protein synthase I n=1 Tax=Thalassotalea insulae TaxID=2056778 RepID=A0ABQ6GTN0_9GAMM|nr:SCO family protein [Thalassotalea insulae]GLX78712.1 photosynthetic protein synthase I [Thalassotalea insulae]
MNNILAMIIAVVAIAIGVLVYQKSFNLAQPEHALYYQTPREIKPFAMTDHQHQAFTNQQLTGKWSWVFFGYTSCPDVCPTTMQELNFYYDDLKAIADNVQILLVSVDPNRDSLDKLAQYVAYFNPEFTALTADHSVLFPFARNLGLMYAISDDDRHDSYLVDHSASIVLINPQGKIAAIFKPQHELGQLPTVSGEHLVSDFDKIVNLASE